MAILEVEGEHLRSIQCAAAGTYSIDVVVTDSSGNQTRAIAGSTVHIKEPRYDVPENCPLRVDPIVRDLGGFVACLTCNNATIA